MMTYDEFQDYIKGKLLIVGLCFYDSNNKLLEQYQTSGTVEHLTDTGILVLKRDDESLFALPYDHTTMSPAAPGEYTEHISRKVIVNPDYIISGAVEVHDPADIEGIKANGFYPSL